jgi:transcriptional regulator GlxA family with amidase domain
VKTRYVRTELTGVQNWPELAAQAHYRVDELVELLDVSDHALRVFFARAFKTTTKKWLHRERILECQRRIKNTEPLKNIAATLGYGGAAHLTHDFKTACGVSPREWAKQERQKPERAPDLPMGPPHCNERLNNVPRSRHKRTCSYSP